jgi:transposase
MVPRILAIVWDRARLPPRVGPLPAIARGSGLMRGKRTVWAGRQQVRTALYMAALTATRFNPAIRTFYQRLVRAGKPKKLALTAAMRKLIIILNAILRTSTPWRAMEKAA